MKIIGRTNYEGYIVELAPEEMRALARLANATEGIVWGPVISETVWLGWKSGAYKLPEDGDLSPALMAVYAFVDQMKSTKRSHKLLHAMEGALAIDYWEL